jgi:acylglycerol lipase
LLSVFIYHLLYLQKMFFVIYSEHTCNSKDGTSLNVHHWNLNENPEKVIILIHGIGEHAGRYHHWAERFVYKNINVVAVDYRGHGKSDGKRGIINLYDNYLDDIQVAIDYADKLYPNKSVVLYAHSMGGNIALNYLLRRKNHFRKAVITSPWIKLYNEPNWLMVNAVRLLNAIFPTYVQKAPIKSNHLSRDPAVSENLKSDAFAHRMISARLFVEMYDAAKFILNNYDRFEIPILLMHGTEDKITSFEGSDLLSKLNPNRIHFIKWQGAYHELHNEIDKDEIFKYVFDWLNHE